MLFRSGCFKAEAGNRLSGVVSGRIDGDPFTILAEFLIGDNTVNLGKQRIVPATADILTRMNPGAELPNQDISGPDQLSAESFHTPSLSCTVATVS